MPPAGDDAAVEGDLVVPLEEDGGGDGGETAGQVRRGQADLGVGVDGDVLTNLEKKQLQLTSKINIIS